MKATRELTKIRVPVPSPAPIEPYLRRLAGSKEGAPAVVLLHGGNTSGDTFLQPEGGLANYLAENEFDVWILEWRSSPHIVGPVLQRRDPLNGSVIGECRLMNLDVAVNEELVSALSIVRRAIGVADLSVLGHCFGSAAVSIAVARGLLERFDVGSIVLSTLGLFVETPWNGWLKAEDFIMERVLHNDPQCRAINPSSDVSWPSDMKSAYEHWPNPWLPAAGNAAQTLLRRLSFMFGQPYSIERLHESLRNDGIAQFFGPMHLGMFLHASQMVRRGFADKFDAPDSIDRASLTIHRRVDSPLGDLNPVCFAKKRVTLLAAGDNHLWHRDSVDLMYEWLRRLPSGDGAQRYKKHVFPGYNLQELLWGSLARSKVFPMIRNALGRRWVRTRPASRPRRQEPPLAVV
jgi:cholesterol oxidase